MLAGSVRGLSRTPRFISTLTSSIVKPLKPSKRFFLLKIALPFYKAYTAIKKVATRFYAPHKSRHKLVHPFSRRYVTHIVVIAAGLVAITANLNAYETRRDEYGQTSIIQNLAAAEDLGTVAEEGPLTSNKRVTRYLGQTGVSQTPSAGVDNDEGIIAPPTVVRDSAVVRSIISPLVDTGARREGVINYVVQEGDTISTIGQKFGISINTILWENNLTSYQLIRPGQTLSILPASGIRHQIARGDTIAAIAKKYDVSPEAIIDFNKLASASDIALGEKLVIPGGKKVVVPAPTYAVRPITRPTASVPTGRVVASGNMTWPASCRRISQYFNLRHTGIDIACPFGTAVVAADGGKVVTAQGGWNGGYGNYVIIDHGNGLQTLYGHLSKIYVSPGEAVTKGQSIGAEGSTGRSTGPHVHFEVRSGGRRANPLSYVK